MLQAIWDSKRTKVPLSEAVPFSTWRRQAKAKLAPPEKAQFAGKTILLVGATGGILSEACRILAGLEVSTLIFGVRNVKKGEALADQIRKDHASVLFKVVEVDLLSFDSVKRFAGVINQEASRIDAIVMGAAIMNKELKATQDGWEQSESSIFISFPDT